MNIAIVGTGSVGTALGEGFVAAGHQVYFGSRDPAGQDARELADRLGTAATVEPIGDAARAGEVVVLAVPAGVAPDLAASVAEACAGKPLVDATNTVPRPEKGSIAGAVADAAPDAHVVKAFNTVGAEWLSDPTAGDEAASMFVCGDDPDARATVAGLAEDLGFESVDAGGLDAAAHLEDLARFWIYLSRQHGRGIAFRLLGA